MKKFLFIALLAVVATTGGVFAYTFTTATITIGVNAIQSDFAEVSVNTSYSPPTVFGRYTGSWPTGTLFDVAPYTGTENYTGDLVIKVYLVNAGELIRRYHHLNMQLDFQDSTGATAHVQAENMTLTLQNAEVLFDHEYLDGTPPYRVEVTGGSYRLHPWRTLTGGAASVQPQLWCEVTQR